MLLRPFKLILFKLIITGKFKENANQYKPGHRNCYYFCQHRKKCVLHNRAEGKRWCGMQV